MILIILLSSLFYGLIYKCQIFTSFFQVLVLSSLRKPKRIKIRGNDEKEYAFLVKGGEDLRLDQRIEQVRLMDNFPYNGAFL